MRDLYFNQSNDELPVNQNPNPAPAEDAISELHMQLLYKIKILTSLRRCMSGSWVEC